MQRTGVRNLVLFDYTEPMTLIPLSLEGVDIPEGSECFYVDRLVTITL